VAFFDQAASVHWRTPPDILERARKVFGGPIELDPCASYDPVGHYATVNWRLADGQNGLVANWSHKKVFINPPFGTSYVKDMPEGHPNGKLLCIGQDEMTRVKNLIKEGKLQAEAVAGWRKQVLLDWAVKVVAEAQNGSEVIWISKAGLETEALQLLLNNCAAILHPKGRIGYINANTGELMGGPTFSSVLFYLGPLPTRFKAYYGDMGTVIMPRNQGVTLPGPEALPDRVTLPPGALVLSSGGQT
jgi:hypothetical protein